MDKPDDTPQFALQLPVWVIMHPIKKSKGYITMSGQAGQSVMPLFTEEVLAQRYRAGAPQLSQFVVDRAGDPGEIAQVVNLMQVQGFTHAAIDPTTKRGILFALDQLRNITSPFAQESAASNRDEATTDDGTTTP